MDSRGASSATGGGQMELFPGAPAPGPPKDKLPGARLAASVAFAAPIGPLSYAIPPALEDSIGAGVLVEAPLRGRTEIGCVVEVEPAEEAAARLAKGKLAPIVRRVSEGFSIPADLIGLSLWIADYYMCSPGEALRCVSFIGFRDLAPRRVKAWKPASPPPAPEVREALTKRQAEALEWIEANACPEEGMAAGDIREALGVTDGVLKRLAEAGLLEGTSVEADCSSPPAPGEAKPPLGEPLELLPSQAEAFAKIAKTIDAGEFKAFLLQGVTGSGKTEIYLQALARTLERGRAGVVLVPEISLTPQTVSRFQARFGDRIGVYHSRLTHLDKLRLWRDIEAGRVDVLVGARSALFAPFKDLGLIVVDEEHEPSYKQESAPRYHARDMALVRASKCNAAALLGSATPSIESAFNAETGKLERLRLDERVNQAPLPKVEIVDMGAAAKLGRVTHNFSRELLSAMNGALASGHQVLLLLNRRGFHSFFFCHGCAAAVPCPHCDVALTHHRGQGTLVCHMCGYRRRAASACPTCGGETAQAGAGTERLEADLAALFPSRSILRLDQDTTGGRHDFEAKWKTLSAGGVDIIMGTQMIAKGLHLERVALVGVVLADIGLHQPDFRAAERTFSLLTQVAGRAGRGEIAGRVFIQTYCPGHYATRHASAHDFDAFYADELARRRGAGFPPFSRLVALTLSGPDLPHLERHAGAIREELVLAQRALGPSRLRVFGPLPPSVARVKDQHRLRFLLSGPASATLRDALSKAIAAAERRSPPAWRRHKLVADVDPMDCA